MRVDHQICRLIYCRSSDPDRILGDLIFRRERGLRIGAPNPGGIQPDLAIDHPDLSRGIHALISARDGQIQIESLAQDNGVRRYRQQLNADTGVVLQRFDYFSMPGRELGDPEDRFIFLFVNLFATRVGPGFWPVTSDQVEPTTLRIFGTSVALRPREHELFSYLQSKRGHMVTYEAITRKLWPDDERANLSEIDQVSDLQVVERYVNFLRERLTKWSARLKLPDPPQLLYHRKPYVRLCLDDVVPALAHRAEQPVEQAQLDRLLSSEAGWILLDDLRQNAG